MHRRLARLFFMAALLAGWLAALTTAAPAAAAGVRLEATAGFDKLARSGAWLPVRVTLTNDGPDAQVVVRVQRRASEGNQQAVSQAVELPANARKQVTLLLLVDGVLGPLTVQALAGDQPLAETRVEVTSSSGGLVGVLASSPETAARVVAGLGARSGAGQAARLTPDDLPTNPHALAALDALIVNGVSTRALTPAQTAALGQWVAGGGALVLGGGGGAPAVLEGLGDLAPVRLTGPAAATARLPGLEALTATPVEAAGPFVVAAAAPLPDAAILAGQAGAPLVVTRPLGLGRVTFVALDLGLDPFLGWTGATRFWQRLLAPVPVDHSAGRLFDAGARLRWPLGSGTALDLPGIGALALLLLGYVVAIGPLNYLLLRRLDRREWAWLTVPLVTLVFTGALFLFGLGTRGGQVAVNTISIVRSTAGAPGASVESYIGVYAPGRAVHTLRLPEGALASSLPDLSRGPGAPLPAQHVWQGGATELRDLPFAAAEFKTFVAQGGLPAAPLTAELRLEGDRLVGAVRNASDRPVQDATLLLGQYVYPLGPIAPGASAGVDWRAPAAPPFGPGGLPLAARLNGGRFPDGGPNQDWRQQARFQTLEVAFGDGEGDELTGAQVIGWQEAAPLPATIAGQEPRQQALTLIRHTTGVTIAPGAVTLPPGLLAGRGETMAAGLPDRFGPGGITIGAGETTIDFLLPAGLAGLEAEELSLVIASGTFGPPALVLPPAAAPGAPAAAGPVPTPTPRPGGGPSAPIPPPIIRGVLPPGAVQFALYDYQRRAWTPLPHAGEGRVVVPDARPYVNPAGPVRLRITAAGLVEPLRLRQVDLGVRGRLP